jgi:Sulfotransferase family
MSVNSMVIPDFIIAGAPKCGTTALTFFLNEHPDVCISSIKEPRFFTTLKGDMEKTITGDGPRLSGTYSNGLDWYYSLFKKKHAGQKTGEASTIYFANEDAPGLIHKHNPHVKIILMLRHPVKRLYSHYWQEYKLGFDFPSFEDMVAQNHPRLRYYKKISHYKEHLERYFALFPKEQLHIIVHEEFMQSPEAHYGKILDFLGLQPFAIDGKKRYNDQVDPKSRKLARILTLLKTTGPVMRKILPQSLFNMANKLRKKAKNLNSQPLEYPPLSAALFDTLTREYAADMDYTAQKVLKKQIPLWHK